MSPVKTEVKRYSEQAQRRSSSRVKRRKREDTDCLSLSCLSDDVILHVMSFVVSESGVVDIESFSNMQQVSQKMHSLSNSRSLWSPTNDRNSPQRRPSHCIRGYQEGTTLESKLIAFSKLERVHCWTGDDSYRVVERGTGKKFMVRISSDADVFEELRMAQMMTNGSAFQCHDRFILPVGVDKVNDDTYIRWYESSERAFPSGYAAANNISCTKMVTKQLLDAMCEFHTLFNHGYGKLTSSNIFIDDDKNTKLLLTTKRSWPATIHSFSAPERVAAELLLGQERADTRVPLPESDVWSIACILAQLARNGVPLFNMKSSPERVLRRLVPLHKRGVAAMIVSVRQVDGVEVRSILDYSHVS